MNLLTNDWSIGATATAGGVCGITIQVVTQFASLTVMLINIALGLGGLYLMWRRIRRDRG